MNFRLMSFYGIACIGGFFLFSMLFGCAHAQNNIAPLAHCSVSPSPNYPFTAGKNDPSFLVNGKYASGGAMWTDPQTLGWSHISQVTLDFSFVRPYTITGVSVHTAARVAAGVNWPLSIMVFTSMNGKDFQFEGDIMKGADKSVTSYTLKTFSLSGLKDAAAKYVRLVAVPDGAFFFTDQVEILGEKADTQAISLALRSGTTLSNKAMNALVSSGSVTARNQRFLLSIADGVNSNANSFLRKKISGIIQNIQNASQIDSAQFDNYKKEILSARVQDNLPAGLLISGYDSPWGKDLNANEFAHTPEHFSKVQKEGVVNDLAYYALNLFNNSSKNVEAGFEIAQANELNIHLFAIKNVHTRDFKIVPDALIPLNTGQSITLTPGESKIILVSLESNKAGNFHPSITFSDGNNTVISNFSYVTKDITAYLSDVKPLNVDVWAYYNEPFYNGIQKVVHADLLAHGVNVLVIPPFVNNMAMFNDNMGPLEQYMGESNGFDHIFLFMDFRRYLGSNSSGFLTDSWKTKFLSGYDKESQEIEKYHFNANQIYLYPFDEVKPWEVNAYLKFVIWFKSVRPNAGIFTTIFDGGIYDQIKGYAGIYQLLIRNPDVENAIQHPGKSQIWIYDIMDNEKSLSPYARFRLLPWEAFLKGASGVGFWNYASMSGTSIWDDFDGGNPDYNVVYNWEGGVISSRRWEAFKRGLEDYKILCAFANKDGMEPAKSICQEVINNQEDEGYADRAVVEMLNKL